MAEAAEKEAEIAALRDRLQELEDENEGALPSSMVHRCHFCGCLRCLSAQQL